GGRRSQSPPCARNGKSIMIRVVAGALLIAGLCLPALAQAPLDLTPDAAPPPATDAPNGPFDLTLPPAIPAPDQPTAAPPPSETAPVPIPPRRPESSPAPSGSQLPTPMVPTRPASPAAPSAPTSPSTAQGGEPDLAYGAFQRGYYLTAFAHAVRQAEAGDSAAATLLGLLYAGGY